MLCVLLRAYEYPVRPHTFVTPSAESRRAMDSYWQKYVHEVLVDRLGGLSLHRESVVKLTDCPDMTLDVYRGRKTITTTAYLRKIKTFTKCIICPYKTFYDVMIYIGTEKSVILNKDHWIQIPMS